MLKNSQKKSIITIAMTMTLALINFMIVPNIQANMTEIQSTELQNIEIQGAETQDTEIQSTITYTYDSLGRLISDTTDQVSTNKYDYDPAGNRLATSTQQQK
ncbi:hypothetical protein; putative exported protein [Xenorhabdus nematophila ATCC 19061]|uniref:Uncharacterized protein n=1 Tax=Xenorhabdus nematophila (strain ATCC 19061 / DSM 3370 / CCUG 14189 / LMG 1036 / NCIMB 9965 / AN6) TaxID=406817 RepID=D3V8W2_XENNA|nr:hypothetical protein [Xenorhabdus nematophila]CBJ89160.1 hypothetical protein; putative exported protein [Xenorhabdus nematophila ATCC 19061]CEE94060.1 hypothetical protein; putative exported protein [Xenorhabdus nematophila str. Anatoliense]CEE94642.1 hypothetical protein; putative exported protein [Xenorhabdus nematophila str. Anatoliense]CEK22068.1 hypothetical protein; putative exported protein [Xenorhabdus nematophila AN6/1]